MGGYYDQGEELPIKAKEKDNRSKTGKDWEYVIQASRDLVNSEQVIKGAEKVGRKNREDDLE